MLVQAGLFSRVQNLSSSTSSIHVIGHTHKKPKTMTFHQGLRESLIRSNQDSIEMIEVWSALQHNARSPWLRTPPYPSWPRSEGCWSWWGWCCAWVSSLHWSDTWSFCSTPSPSASAGRASPHRAVCLGENGQGRESVNVPKLTITLTLMFSWLTVYLKMCWRCTLRPGYQICSSQRGASTPCSTSAWTRQTRQNTVLISHSNALWLADT